MAPHLEGFYYDKEKRKYFKILPQHQAPEGVKYSKEAVKKQQGLAHASAALSLESSYLISCTRN